VVETDENGDEQIKYIKLQTGEENIAAIMNQKKENSASTTWLVSNCDETRGASMRLEFAQRLIQAGLSFDGYGQCFNNTLLENPWSSSNGPGVLTKYKFYLAFENSIHCRDYLSEKFWRNSLGQGLVPVVYGTLKEDVEAVAPPNSYIHVDDFDSPKALVNYLDYLAENQTAYEEYHQWRLTEPTNLDEYQPLSTDAEMTCGICKELRKRRQAGNPKRTYKSVTNWWWVNQPDLDCTAGNELAPWITNMKTVTKENTFDEMNSLDSNFQSAKKPNKPENSTFGTIKASLVHQTKKIIKRSTRSLKKMLRK